MSKKIALTGIKPTGMPHLGNFFGAIKPALELSETYESRYFIADYHALNTIQDAETLKNYTYEVCATWIASGLDPEKILLYRQSDVPETFELNSFLMNFTAKGLMNRAHAYKAVSGENIANGKDQDFKINMGLYTYPILMAADILLFDTEVVPVGADQVQHVEYTADIAQRVNHTYGEELLVIPSAKISGSFDVVKGSDGRKMSKSYNNTIPLYQQSKKMRKQIMKVVTNSQEIEESKDPDVCNVFALYRLFASEAEQDALAERYRAGGLGWGHAKQELFEKMEEVLGDNRDRYFELLEDKEYMDKVLKEGAEKAREIASQTMKRLRKAAGFNLNS